MKTDATTKFNCRKCGAEIKPPSVMFAENVTGQFTGKIRLVCQCQEIYYFTVSGQILKKSKII